MKTISVLMLVALVGCDDGGPAPNTGAAGYPDGAAGSSGGSGAPASAGAAGSDAAGAAGAPIAGSGGGGSSGSDAGATAGAAGSSPSGAAGAPGTGGGGAAGGSSYPTCASPFRGDATICTGATVGSGAVHKDGFLCAICSAIPGGQTGNPLGCIVPDDGTGSGGELCVAKCDQCS